MHTASDESVYDLEYSLFPQIQLLGGGVGIKYNLIPSEEMCGSCVPLSTPLGSNAGHEFSEAKPFLRNLSNRKDALLPM